MPNTKIELYNLDVVTGTFTRKAVITNYFDLEHTESLNGIGSCSFKLNVLEPSLTKANFIPYITQIAVKENNTIIWVGPYSNFSGDVKDIDGTITINAYSYLHHLNFRNTDKLTEFNNVEQTQILRNLVDLIQNRPNGKLGITLNSENTGILRDRTYEYKNVAEAFIQMSQVINGMDFDFIPIQNGAGLLSSVNLQFYNLKKGTIRNNLPALSLGKLGTVYSANFSFNGELYNSIISEGSGSQDTIIQTYDNDALQKGYTRREYFLPQKSVSDQDTLNDNINSFANYYSVPRFVLNADFYANTVFQYGQIFLGDTLNVDVNIQDISPNAGDLIQFNGQARIVELRSVYDDNGVKTIIPKIIFNS